MRGRRGDNTTRILTRTRQGLSRLRRGAALCKDTQEGCQIGSQPCCVFPGLLGRERPGYFSAHCPPPGSQGPLSQHPSRPRRLWSQARRSQPSCHSNTRLQRRLQGLLGRTSLRLRTLCPEPSHRKTLETIWRRQMRKSRHSSVQS